MNLTIKLNYKKERIKVIKCYKVINPNWKKTNNIFWLIIYIGLARK